MEYFITMHSIQLYNQFAGALEKHSTSRSGMLNAVYASAWAAFAGLAYVTFE